MSATVGGLWSFRIGVPSNILSCVHPFTVKPCCRTSPGDVYELAVDRKSGSHFQMSQVKLDIVSLTSLNVHAMLYIESVLVVNVSVILEN
jgi:hypothetical protein